jgi:murein DD-endopeptidase MepM/ murein hydrolase activator NlpD
MSTVPVVDYYQLPFSRSTFGNRFGIKGPFYGPQGHRGTDFVRGAGTPIPAIAHGVVTDLFWSSVLGHVTVVKHVEKDGDVVYSGYCHQSAQTVRVGQTVKRGQIIGRVGTTGSASSGNHLHMTMSRSRTGVTYGAVFDPIAYIAAHDRPAPAAPAKATAKYTTAKKGEGLSAIASRVKIALPTIERLNPDVEPPHYQVALGQKIRIR